MDIKKAIQQKRPFRNAHHQAMVNLLFTNNWTRDHIKSIFKPFGITAQQYNVLRIINGAPGPVSTLTIRERLLDKMADTSRLVDRLFQKNLVTRTENKKDKRLVDVSLTEDGKTLMQKLEKITPQLDQLYCNLTEDEAETLSKLLDKIRHPQPTTNNE